MKNKRVKNLFKYVFLALLLLFVTVLGGRGIIPAFADTTDNTSVLADLQKDSEFNVADYPAIYNDYSLQVIQIAESTDNKLFLYVYQPAAYSDLLVATNINMSLFDNAANTALYDLELLSRQGVFAKYLVKDFTVNTNEAIRLYNITSIYRKYIEGIDSGSSDESIISAKAFPVGKLFIAISENGKTIYKCEKQETIEIIDPFFDYLAYNNGFKLYKNKCHSHYVAFSTDKKIDTLMEATVSFSTQSYYRLNSTESLGNPVQNVVNLNGNQTGSNPADGWFAKKYEWERIQSVDEFVKSESLKPGTLLNLKDKQWVLRFFESDWKLTSGPMGLSGEQEIKTVVSDVTILRLKFMCEGRVYDLGTVSDMGHSDDNAGNINTDEYASLFEWLERLTGIPQWVWKLILIFIVLSICLPVLSLIFPSFGLVLKYVLNALLTGIKYLLKGLWWLICLPFRGIAFLVRKIRGD